MLGTAGRKLGIVAIAALALGAGSDWAKGSRARDGASPALWIAADRVTGFVPFTVSLYGKVTTKVEPPRLEMCRETAVQTDFAAARGMADPMSTHADRSPSPVGPIDGAACVPVRLVPGRDGFDYTHEMRFDRPGTYRVRLSMTDENGRRAISNTVQVNAL